MTKEEALALFDRVYETLSCRLFPCEIQLMYAQGPGVLRTQKWMIGIDFDLQSSAILNEQEWQQWKLKHSVLETVEDTEAYADARRAEAENGK